MIWRHVMLAVHNVDYVPAGVIDRVGHIVRGLQAELGLFSSIYQPDRVRDGQHGDRTTAIDTLLEDAHRRLEHVADLFREQSITVRSSVSWDYPVYEAVVRQVLRHRVDLLVVPARATGDIRLRTLHYREAPLDRDVSMPAVVAEVAGGLRKRAHCGGRRPGPRV